MHTINATLPNKHKVDQVVTALADAGVSGTDIDVEATGDGENQLLSVDVDDDLVDAAMAILSQAKARHLNAVDHHAESEEADRVDELSVESVITPMR